MDEGRLNEALSETPVSESSLPDSKGVKLSELIRLYEEHPEDRAEYEKQQADLGARISGLVAGPATDLAGQMQEIATSSLTKPPVDFGHLKTVSDAIKSLAAVTSVQPFAKSIAAITEQQRQLDSVLKPIRDIERLMAPIRQMEKLTETFREVSRPQMPDFSPKIDPVVFRDFKLEAAIETKHAVEDLRDATLELVSKQDSQIEHLEAVNQALGLAREQAERALSDEKELSETSRREAQQERITAKSYNRNMMFIAMGSALIALISVVVAILGWLYPRAAIDLKGVAPAIQKAGTRTSLPMHQPPNAKK